MKTPAYNFVKKILLLSIYTTLSTILYSKNDDSLRIFLTKYQKVVFLAADTTYKFTKFIAPNGKFYFTQGFADSLPDDGGYFYGYSDLVLIEKPGNYRLSYKNEPFYIDTIESYLLHTASKYSQKDIIDEVKFSYILRQLKEPKIINESHNIIRICYPTEEFNFCNEYKVYKIRFFIDSAILYRSSVRSDDYSGIKLIGYDSCSLKGKDIERIKKQIKIASVFSDTTCNQQGNSWILEYKDSAEYKHFIISDYCISRNEYFTPIRKLCLLIMDTYNKYILYHKKLVYPKL